MTKLSDYASPNLEDPSEPGCRFSEEPNRTNSDLDDRAETSHQLLQGDTAVDMLDIAMLSSLSSVLD